MKKKSLAWDKLCRNRKTEASSYHPVKYGWIFEASGKGDRWNPEATSFLG